MRIRRPHISVPAATLAIFTMGATLSAGEKMPRGFFRGTVLSWEGTPALGVLTARAADGMLFDCGYDSKSYLELERQRVTVAKLREGDRVEILADRQPGQTACYVRTLEVLTLPAPRSARRPEPTKASAAPKPAILRHGNQTIAGLVTRADERWITLRTRTGQEVFLLRRDTRFFGNGLKMEASDVTINLRVSVEAAANSDGVLEAFQVTWGDVSNVP
ncbi:MAG: hypothetical protein ABI811_11785 [Acidobacteriota bacterium]